MTLESLIILIVIGAIAGWLAGQIMKGGGFGLIGDIIVGIVGSFIGGWLWGVLHLPGIGPWWLTESRWGHPTLYKLEIRGIVRRDR